MAFGDEDLMELRAQLIGAGQEPRGALGERGFGLGMAAGAGGDTPRQAVGDRPPSPGPAASHGGPQERDEFLKMVGHELRNPLATIQSSVDLLQAHASSEEPPYVQQARPRLARQVEHLSRLVDVLLGSEPPAAPGDTGGEAAATVALVRRVVELQGGRVSAHGGSPGCDTELRVWLPAAPPEEPSADGSLPVAPKSRSRRILVVDDNEDAAEMLALVLRKRGFTVVLAFDGEEALTMAQAHHPDVVLLDIGLPGIDGYEVARRLRASPLPERPVLIAVTGYGQPADRVRSREAGFDHHLVKPVAMEKLLPLLEPAADEARDPR
jgi:CheY-like chemotaxis protein